MTYLLIFKWYQIMVYNFYKYLIKNGLLTHKYKNINYTFNYLKSYLKRIKLIYKLDISENVTDSTKNL